MPRTIKHGAGGNYPDVLPGWYLAESVQVNEKPKPTGFRLGIAFKILDTEFANQWVWLNVLVHTEPKVDSTTGERTMNSNFRIRQLQHLIDPEKHPDPKELKIDGNEGEFLLEDNDWFIGRTLGILVEHRPWQEGNRSGVSIEIKNFRLPSDAESQMASQKSKSSSDPWDEEKNAQGNDYPESY